MNYEEISKVLKAMADPNRIKIIDLLSNGTLCACEVLKHFEFTQPTLSHHMKVLEKANIVSVDKQGKWYHYTLRDEFVTEFMKNMHVLLDKELK
ncbi:ArsR/SmtB family transcription factor [Vagococcus carniphilus]|uniref:Metalloregulator ArsR/SmtB family transcription factor n=1 Tax=Vagococcus carniphilus TaxID=218144 RepID=A0A430B6S2_9ENTE|nr:metalloregulator ArsR/SmtB family transcription factor [Vagococcus carniphilus]MDT2815208.1 metalloregulator ArsR/SmtB family transcription factor [Vagococcus carniphilus]MDT2831111.1 metalloregulator ArsR/SmtB family transcription factor [Vagococcus carniphilus]MDT2833299.1 metalloregulator ArsR/SmtB family transcription factor [Vagococcus carniphilus]MDT2839730.1 metalloregulator ArsR/SmtB family transcription factor [Vagococcus carniphilus]MDT2849163.1 metalloregulator ArsR/SmtB family t